MNSLAPSIYGYDHIKESIMYLLFGGVPKNLPDITIRGEMNALLIGDPGTAKSQLLQYVARIAPRGLYTSGRGTTAAGLTAAVIREKGGGMSLEAGALVLADKGIACIDEMDKMRPEDRVAIHEAMEQHTVSVAKGGIVATLNARTAILAAANPALGRYEPHRTVAENISLPVTILSRFDLIFVLRDVPNKEADGKMSEHILEMHRKGLSPVEPPIPLDLLRKYISYAKGIKPVLTQEALQRLKDFYLAMRSASESEGSPVAITARQLESLVRIAEAKARVALRKEVLSEDAEAAITIMKRSLEEVGIDLSSYKIDIDLIMTGKPKSVRDKLQTVLSTLMEMEKETGIVEKTALLNELETKYTISTGEAERLIGQLLREGTIYEPREGYLKKT
jgi:replicative DNA helicase Mcm